MSTCSTRCSKGNCARELSNFEPESPRVFAIVGTMTTQSTHCFWCGIWFTHLCQLHRGWHHRDAMFARCLGGWVQLQCLIPVSD